jgi:polyphosphate kinase 2 (PPK2 family)
MNLTKKLKVTPGSQVNLASVDPSFHGKWEDPEDAKPELDRNLSRITASQRKLYADRRHGLLIILQGIDSAGKDGTCWHGRTRRF